MDMTSSFTDKAIYLSYILAKTYRTDFFALTSCCSCWQSSVNGFDAVFVELSFSFSFSGQSKNCFCLFPKALVYSIIFRYHVTLVIGYSFL